MIYEGKIIISLQISDDTLCSLEIIEITEITGENELLLNKNLNNSHAIIIMYDITDKNSYKSVSYFNQFINENCDENKKVILLGNKSDLENKREVSLEEGKSLAELNDFIFMEVSCEKNKNIKEAMEIAISLGLIEKNYQKSQSQKELQENSKSLCLII